MASGDRQDRVGIVVPVPWEGDGVVDAGALRATLQSLADQTHTDLEVVVVHGADIDLGIDDPRIRLVVAVDPGPTAILDAGLAALAGRWVRFLPVGDRLAPGCLAAELAAVEDDPGVVAVLSAVERVDERGARLTPEGADLQPAAGRYEPGTLLPELVERNPWPLGAALLDREALVEVGGFDLSLVARPEHELWLRLLTGFSARVLADVGLRSREPRASVVDGAEHARILLRLLRGDRLEATVRALGGGPRDAPEQGIARAELARRVLRANRVELRPLAHRLVREARGAGAYFPADAPFEDLAAHAPELVRSDGWFLGATVVPPDRAATPSLAFEGTEFPPAVRVAVGTSDEASVEAAGPFLDRAGALAEHGIELVLLHAAGADVPAPAFSGPAEVLRHEGSTEEIEAALVRHGVSVLVAEASHPASRLAERLGLAALGSFPEVGGPDSVGGLARELIRSAAAASARFRRSMVQARLDASRRVQACATEEATLRTLVAAIGEAGSVPHVGGGSAGLLDRLADARRDADAARRRARDVDSLTQRTLDKLRIGRRLRETFGADAPTGPNGAAPVASLDLAKAESFLEAASSSPRLWVLYTTDPYSETQGQRSTWLARELLTRGDAVVFFYWRWELSEPIAATTHERLLPVPIDQFFRLQRPLMDLAAAGLEKVLLIEFPDAYLFEQIDFANAHGFTTVYDCVDDWEEFARVGQAHWYDPGIERHLVRNADVVLATHPVLAKRLETMGRPPGSVPVVANGVALDSLADAPPRARTGTPVIGYFGHLTPAWFDWDLIRETAAAHPQWSFEIVGHGARDDLELPPNVSVPGPIPHEQLEEKTRSWHVGIVPFRPGRLTQAVDPIKLYEYLALGLPSVVVDMPHLEGVPCVEVCTREGFAAALSRALDVDLDREAVAEFVAASRWSVRTDALCEEVARAASTDLLEAL